MEPIVPDTIRDLGTFGLQRIIPCHCTGWRALHALATIYKEDVLMSAAVGRVFAF